MDGMEARCGFPARRRRQAGAAMIEFAFVFPILLFLIYGLVVYAYIFVMQQSITFAAQQGASAAIAVSPQQTTSAAQSQMTTLAQSTVNSYMSWLGAGQLSRISSAVTFCPGAGVTCPTDGSSAVVVTVFFNLSTPTPLFPVLSFGSGQVPPMPTQLVSAATVRL